MADNTNKQPAQAGTSHNPDSDSDRAQAPAAAAPPKAEAANPAADKAAADKTGTATKAERKDLLAIAQREGREIKEAYKTADGFIFLQRGSALAHARTLKDQNLTHITV